MSRTSTSFEAYKNRVYTYDAQNRLRLVHNTNDELIATFYYDGKNRQIARHLNPDQSGAGGEIRFSVWDGWELIEEWANGATRSAAYLQGATGVIKSWTISNTVYYYQDKLGSTTHIANTSGTLLESFHYDLYGTPSYFDSTSQPLNSSTHNIVDLALVLTNPIGSVKFSGSLANYLIVHGPGSLNVPEGWTQVGWYYAHPIPTNTIPSDDKAVARAYKMVVVGAAPPQRPQSTMFPMIEFYPK